MRADDWKAPDTIWLQATWPDVTWCEDQIEDDDVQYTRTEAILAPGGALDRALAKVDYTNNGYGVLQVPWSKFIEALAQELGVSIPEPAPDESDQTGADRKTDTTWPQCPECGGPANDTFCSFCMIDESAALDDHTMLDDSPANDQDSERKGVGDE